METRSEFAIVEGMSRKLNAVAKWTEKDGVIYFTVVSNAITGKEWIKHFETKEVTIGDYAKELLLSNHFKSAKKGTIHNIAVIKGEFFSDENRTTRRIRAEADRRKMKTPPPEVACLIRDLFTNEEIKAIGLFWIVTMHEPIEESGGDSVLLGANRYATRPWLYGYGGRPGNGWDREVGFAFVSP